MANGTERPPIQAVQAGRRQVCSSGMVGKSPTKSVNKPKGRRHKAGRHT